MKRNLLILAIVLLIGFIVNSCGGDEENECSICKNGQHCYTHCVNENCPVHDCNNHNKNECPICNPICNLGAHLGIDETCNGNNCTLQDHRNAAQKIAFPDNGVGRPIYRYGKLSNYNISDPKEIEKTVDKIIDIFTGTGGLNSEPQVVYDRINDNIDKLCVTKTSGDYGYTWGGDGTVLGVDPVANAVMLKALFLRIDKLDSNNLPTVSPVANLTQLQPTSNIRLAKGKKSTEQFPIITDYIGNLTYATVVYKKYLYL